MARYWRETLRVLTLIVDKGLSVNPPRYFASRQFGRTSLASQALEEVHVAIQSCNSTPQQSFGNQDIDCPPFLDFRANPPKYIAINASNDCGRDADRLFLCIPASWSASSLSTAGHGQALVNLLQRFEQVHGIVEGLQRIRTSPILEHDTSPEGSVVMEFVKWYREVTIEAERSERTGMFAEAELLCREAVTSDERVLGSIDPRTIFSIYRLARVLDNVHQDQEVHTPYRCASDRAKQQIDTLRRRVATVPFGFDILSTLPAEQTRLCPGYRKWSSPFSRDS